VVAKTATNVIVSRDLQKSPAMTALIDHYRPFFLEVAQRKVGSLATPLLRATNEAGESALGDVIADAILDQTAAPASGGAQIALWNTGGIRSDLIGQPAAAGQPIDVIFSQAFDVLPFGNRVEVRTVTGATLIAMLQTGVFQVSRGISYQVDPSRPRRERVDGATVTLNGRPIDPAARLRVASSDFIWNGGDAVVVPSSEPLDVGSDIDLFVAYLQKHSPIRPGPQDRMVRK
jgi:5'-nucleotidase